MKHTSRNLAPTVLVVLSLVFNRATAGEVIVSTEEQLEAVAGAAEPGDEIAVRDGTYTDWHVSLQGSGTAARPIVFKAQTPGRVKLTGNVRIEISGSHLVVSGFLFEDAHGARHASVVEFRGAHHCRLTDCSFVNCGDPESTFTRTINLAYGSSHNRVDYCYMTGTLSMGMGVVVRNSDAGRGNTDNQFDHNYFKDIRRRSSNGQEPIQLGQDQAALGSVPLRALVEYNLFENASGDAEIISNKSADNTIRRNTLRDSKAGICLRGGRNALVEGNYCLRTRGIRIYGDGHKIVNNYLEETEGGICLDAGQHRAGQFVDRKVSGSYQAASDVLVAHNTIVNPVESGIRLGHDRGRTHDGVAKNELPHRITLANNLITGNKGILVSDEGSHEVTWRTNAAWPRQDARLGLSHPGILEIDPQLVRDDGIRYMPGPRSALRGAGTILPEVPADYAGRKRAGLPDIGSDEASQGEAANKPLGPRDVGPAWARAADE